MRIAIGNDHRGVTAKKKIIDLIEKLGHTVDDLGAQDATSIDYPDIAKAVADDVVAGSADRGILVCGTGVGMQIAANKVDSIRAATCDDVKTAELIRRHNDTNVLCLASEFVCPTDEKEKCGDSLESVVQTWLDAPFDGGRHAVRVEKIADLEK